jgi:putative aldouronate transport system substrate-binding protein
MPIFKRLLCFVLVLGTGGALCFGGGGRDGGGQTAAGETITIAVAPSTFVSEFKNNYFTRYLEKKHQVNLDFYLLPTASADIISKISLMAASNDFQDVLLTGVITRETRMDYGSKGAFAALNKYLDDPAKAPNWTKIRESDKSLMRDSMTSADGNIYGLGTWGYSPWNQYGSRMWINQAWLDKLGLKTPGTTEELKDVLIAFRDRDPNGNGLKDEIGIWGRMDGWGTNTVVSLLNSFVFYNPDAELTLDPAGKGIVAPYTDPAFRKGLQYLNDLFKEGLLSPAVFTNDDTQFRAALAADTPVVGFTGAASTSNWGIANESANYKAMSLIGPLKGPGGVQFTPAAVFVPPVYTYITSKSQAREALAFQIFESFYDFDTAAMATLGEKGVDWSDDPKDIVGYSNAYAEMGIIDRVTYIRYGYQGRTDKSWYGATYNNYLSFEWAQGSAYPLTAEGKLPPSEIVTIPHYNFYMPCVPENLLPLLNYTPEEIQRVAPIIADLTDYVRQSIAEFVVGTRDINRDDAWNNYLRVLNSMGLNDWITTAQAAYNRRK